jgi:flagellar basal-body rod protein FlgF
LAVRLHYQRAMDNLTISAVSGLRARMESLDLLAHNLANSSTAGFKADREIYRQYLGDSAEDGDMRMAALAPVVEGRWTDFSQGPLAETGRPLDLALSGRGFFVIEGSNGPRYTRDGSFHVSADGRLTDRGGQTVRLLESAPGARLDPRVDVEIARDGTVRQGGQALGRIAVVDFAAVPNEKIEGNYFSFSTAQPIDAAGTEILQGRTEQSNASAPEQAVRLVNVMRQFELLNRAMALGGEMGRKVVDEVARVNP